MQKGLIDKIINYHLGFDGQGGDYKSELGRASNVFAKETELDPEMVPEVEPFFLEWLIFDFKLSSGKTLLENYLKNNFDRLSLQDAEECRTILETQSFGIFSVEKVRRDEGIQIKDNLSGKIYQVKEKLGTRGMKEGQDIFARLGLVKDHWELVGAQGFIFPLKIDRKILKSWKEEGELDFLKVAKMLIEWRSQKGSQAVDFKSPKEEQEEIDPKEACRKLDEFFKKHQLNNYITSSIVLDWAKKEGTPEEVFTVSEITLALLHLLDSSGKMLDKEDAEELTKLVSLVLNSAPRDRFQGKSPQEMKNEKRSQWQTSLNEISSDGFEYLNMAIEEMNSLNRDLVLARMMIEKGMALIIRNKAVFTDPYRPLANLATVYLNEGDLKKGEFLLDLALDLNSNYKFAGIQKKALKRKENQEGAKEKSFYHGILYRQEAVKFEEDSAKWSTKKILKKLAEMEIDIDKDELMAQTRKDFELKGFFDEKIEPQTEESAYVFMPYEEDFLMEATEKLWNEWRSDNDYIIEYLFDLYFQLEDLLEEELTNFKKLADIMSKIERCAEKAPEGFWRKFSQYPHESYGLFHVLFTLLAEKLWDLSRVLSWGKKLERIWNNEKIKENPWKLFVFAEKISKGEGIEKDFEKFLVSSDWSLTEKYDLTIILILFLGNSKKPKGELIRKMLTEFLEKVQDEEKRADQKDLPDVYDLKIKILEEMDERGLIEPKARKENKKLLKELEKKKEKVLLKMANIIDEEITEAWDEEFKEKSVAVKYYNFFKKTGLNFATEQPTAEPISIIGAGGKQRIGRNDPCICGSGKKYKKCCGR